MNTVELDFLNENSLRNFPIREGQTRLSSDGLMVIPDDFLVDMSLSIGAPVDTTAFISKIINASDTIVVEVSLNVEDILSVLGTFTIYSNTHEQNKDYYLVPTDSYVGANGRATVSSIASLLALPAGVFTFDQGATRLESRVVVPSVAGLNRITFKDALDNVFTMTGNVIFQVNSNLRFRNEGNTVYLDAGNGLGLNKDCAAQPPPIRTINGVPGDENGDFTLIPAECAEFVPITNGLLLKDTCSKPCLGCNELAVLTDRAVAVETDLLKLRDFENQLNAAISQLTTLITYTYDCQ